MTEPSVPSTPPGTSPAGSAASGDGTDVARGLEPGHRFRCRTCGNLTRFDVVATERTRRFHHFDLAGAREVEEEEVLARTVEQVVCRWCGNEDVAVEPVTDPAG